MIYKPAILLLFILFASCETIQPEICQFIDQETNKKKSKVELLKDKIESWSKNSHRRMDFIQIHYNRFKEPLSNIENAILEKDINMFSENKINLDKEFDYLRMWIKSDHWQNIDFYWLIDKAKNEFNKLNIISDKKCQNGSLLQFYDIEADFLSTLYLIGYSDEHVFSKLEPYITLDKSRIKAGDSILVNNYIIAYDSTRVYEMTYWVNDSTFNPENAIVTNDFHNYITGQKGINKVYGIIKLYQYNKVIQRRWYATFEVE